ncbi:MAG: SDR family NAD(P)-dependent oxidoreductase [Alphaproteobacteria bacterium]|nr:SDR family NAD(P)-dependent oxidoreductase [Alphaproteobacteria bacterium]
MSDDTTTRAALVVGAGDYLGAAIARRFAREGYHVTVTRRRGDLDGLVAAIEDDGGRATGFHSDARDEDQVKALVAAVEDDIGPLEVVVFNVGGNVHFPVIETTARVYRKVWEMCAFAGFLVGREAARRMLERQRGTILFTGATASLRGAPGFAAFAGGKHALRALAQSLARELGPEGIHVAHVVIDGPIDTAATRELFPQWFETRPADGVMQPDDLAEIYWQLHVQPRTAWTFETDVRTYVEPW